MSGLLWGFDAVLALTLVGLAIRVLTARDLFHAVVLFIVFGLLMAVAWTRLQAPDIALAEAAIGAGLTGALFLSVLGPRGFEAARRLPEHPRLARVPLALLALALALVSGAAVYGTPGPAFRLEQDVAARIPISGATNPVTAVLLNFRAYDTLLEIGVLLLAVVGVWSLRPDRRMWHDREPVGPVLLTLVRIFVPVIGVVGAYLLWVGTRAPGGAFQAGAVLGGAGVLLLLASAVRPPTLRAWPERAAVVLGFAAFLGIALAVMLGGRRFLEYPLEAAGGLILVIEVLLTISIAVVLVALFAGGPPARAPSPPEDSV